MKNNKIILLICMLVAISASQVATAQTNLSSPYSRYGLGELNTNNNALNMAMGGITHGLRSNSLVNHANPASYTAIDTMSFVFNGGINGYWKTLSTNDVSQPTDYFTMSDLSMAFPITRWLKAGAGMSPYSSVGYYIQDERNSDEFGHYYHLYEGSGGINKTFTGLSVELFDRLSIGANYNYVWGDITKSYAVAFPDSTFMKHTQVSDEMQVKSHYYNFGLQYEQPIGKDMFLALGASYIPTQKLKANTNMFGYTYQLVDGNQGNIDTILYIEGADDRITLPQNIGVGFTVSKKNRYTIGGDFSWQEWSKYEYMGVSDSLSNSFQLALGGEFIPKHTTLSNYFRFVTYRLGARYGKSYLNINNTQLNEFGISFGVGLPLLRTKSAINLGFEYGGRGTIDNNLIKEDYFKVTLGVSINEIWFVQRKFD